MGQKLRRTVAGLLVGVLLFLQFFQVNNVQAATEITPLKYHKENNYRYFVGMMYYDMWKKTDGTWTDGGRQPNKGMRGEATFTYKFQFPTRKIKNVEARIYTPSDPVSYFEESRSDRYSDFSDAISNGTINSDIRPFQKQGIGTDTTTIPITINLLLNAAFPRSIKDQECPTCASEVEAYRIFIPMLFKIELATQLNVKYFTTDGQSLNNIFTPRVDEEMVAGKNYSFTPPTDKDYEYVGYKKSTTDDLPSGSITPGNPFAFSYDGSFEKYTLFMYYKKKDGQKPDDPKPVPPSCTVPAPGQKISGKFMDPIVTAKIKADSRGNEKLDVLQGIPTSESLYGNVFARDHLFQNKFVQMTGRCTYTIDVNKEYTLTWDPGKKVSDGKGGTKTVPDPQAETESKTYQYTIERPYAFWKIDNLEVYKIKQSILSNYALPNEQITIQPAGYTAPYFSASTNGNFYPPSPPSKIQAPSETVSGGTTKPSIPPGDSNGLKSEAEKTVEKIKVENDSLDFNGKTIMNNQRVDETGPTPDRIPEPQQIGENVLYSSGNMISSSKVNKKDTPSSGKIQYDLMQGNIKGGSNKEFPIYGINTVTVHTPVVIYASISDDKKHNQKTVPAPNRDAIILDRPFTIYMPTDGQHLNIPGYGNRDYAKYVRDKQVWFPFDVYSGDKSRFYPKNTWISIPVNQGATTFNMPVWVDEGYYDVLFRTIAENAPVSFTTQSEANTNLTHHVATDSVPVDVVGRLYDFHVTDIADFNWETVFRQTKGSSVPTGNSFWVGPRDIDGSARPTLKNYVLPVRQGSNPLPGMKNISVKTGYSFKFDLKTKGNLFGDEDGVRIKPTFYFVAKNGKNRQPVDLYYHSDRYNFIKIGSPEDVEKRNVVLNARLRNVPGQDLVDTSSTLWELFARPRGWTIDKQHFMEQYIKNTSKSTYVGGYDVQILTAPLRTFRGNMFGLPDGVNIYRANAAVQQWYGEYSLPAAVYIVPKGTNLAKYGSRLDNNSKVFLKDGYIVVNFTFETIRKGDTSKPYLQYIRRPGSPYYGAYNNQWKDMEGFESSFTTPNGVTFTSVDGDVLYYDADKSSYDDFGSSGTH